MTDCYAILLEQTIISKDLWDLRRFKHDLLPDMQTGDAISLLDLLQGLSTYRDPRHELQPLHDESASYSHKLKAQDVSTDPYPSAPLIGLQSCC